MLGPGDVNRFSVTGMRDVISDIIKRDYTTMVPEAGVLRNLAIKRDSRFGLHVVNSPRFICDLDVTGHRNQALSVKVFVKNRGNVLDEFKNMTLLWRTHYAWTERYHIPEPLYIDSERALLFLRYWPGESFLSIFYKSIAVDRQKRAAMLKDYVEGAAKWLADFQSIYRTKEEKGAPQELFNFEERISSVNYLDRGVRQRIIDKMTDLRGTLPKLPETYVHDQYLFRNILYRRGEVCVVDFPHFRTGWPLYDFFTFYTGLERLKQYPLFSKALADSMKDLFARAYFAEKATRYDQTDLENTWAFFIAEHIGQRYRNRTIGRIRAIVNDSFIKKMYDKLSEWSKT
jgi:hypothetical protein